ncbi:MAG: Calcineurin-like phosphoeSPTERase [Firmicutes bacterium]|nr:Calcineurin-like phosphoeSPTERase [Bacillota bacterium]
MTFSNLVIISAIALVSWLNLRLLTRIFRVYASIPLRYIYLILTITAVLSIGFGLTQRPAFVVPGYAVYNLLFYFALIWTLGQLFLLLLQPLLYIVHRMLKGKKAASQPAPAISKITRREFLHGTLAAAPLLTFGVGARGIYEAQSSILLRHHALTFSDLPPAFRGFKIAQISDTHIGPYFDLAKLETVILQLQQEKPDLVVITGDLADDLSLLKPALSMLDDLQSSIPYGLYYCYGNHEYFRNIDYVRAEINKSKIIPLTNESRPIGNGQEQFYLMGVDYPWADATKRTGINVSSDKRRQYFASALAAVPPNAFKILIAHHPDSLFDGFQATVPLTLAGHTHGGQISLLGKPLISSYTYMYGLYETNGVYGYVSSGTGHWFPFRINCPPEIAFFTLHA